MNISPKRRIALLFSLSTVAIAAIASFVVLTAQAGHLPFLVTTEEATVIHPEKVDQFCSSAKKGPQADLATIMLSCQDAHDELEADSAKGCADALDDVVYATHENQYDADTTDVIIDACKVQPVERYGLVWVGWGQLPYPFN